MDTTMKNLIIVRHAKSSWKYDDLDDFDRPLNSRGKGDAPLMGKILRRKGILPELIFSSPALRALKTGIIIAAELGYTKNIYTHIDLYHADEETMWKKISEQSDEVQHLMLIGHNPGLTYFVNILSSEVIDNLPTCGIFSVTWDCESWQKIEKGKANFDFFDFPKNHK